MKSIDVLIVGGGTAGCILANRLSAEASCNVVVLEAGGAPDDERIRQPNRWPSLLGSEFDWKYQSEPQIALHDRRLPYPRGKVLGGSSSINAMGHHRGHREIFDGWEKAGNPGWGFAGLLPYFKKSEDFSGGADAYRATGGPVGVVRPEADRRSPVAISYLRAIADHGFGFTEDFNGAVMEGAAWNQLAIRDGVRQTTAISYLAAVRDRANLEVRTGITTLSLVIEGKTCVGAQVADPDGVRVIRAGTTILCAGAIDSPRLLMLSGIGPADALKRFGIAPVVDLAGVGRNLHDHALAGLVYRPKKPIPVSRFNHADGIFYGKSEPGRATTDLLIMCVTTKKFSTPKTGPVPEDGYSLVPALMAPRSRGTLTLSSNDARAPARIDPQCLRDPLDFSAFMRAVELAREIGHSGAMAEWRGEEILPGPEVKSRADLESFVRDATTSFMHPVGTCRMGNDDGAVVDARLRVRGVDGLRVVDASVMPHIPNALPNATVIALAEKAAADFARA